MTEIESARILIRTLQEMLFKSDLDPVELFKITLEINNWLDVASVKYNNFLNK